MPSLRPRELWKLTPVSEPNAPATDRFSHGIGSGDINGDGRNDILVVEGWWEAPADKAQSTWVFHPQKFGEACAQMYAYDFDGDGDNDVLSSSAHWKASGGTSKRPTAGRRTRYRRTSRRPIA